MIIWVVAVDGTVLAHEVVDMASVLDTQVGGGLEKLAEEMEDAIRIYGRSILRKLYNLCVYPVQDALRGQSNLVIVPAGQMCLIPWAALMDRRGRYLLEAHVLRVVPCLHTLHRIHQQLDRAARASMQGSIRRQPQSQSAAAVVGDPFPISHSFGSGDPDDAELLHATEEVSEVQRVLEERGVAVTMLVREAATRANTLAASQGADWVHMTAHVERSQLLLAQSEGDVTADASSKSGRKSPPEGDMAQETLLTRTTPRGGAGSATYKQTYKQTYEGGAGSAPPRRQHALSEEDGDGVGGGEVACACEYRGQCNMGDCVRCNRHGRCNIYMGCCSACWPQAQACVCVHIWCVCRCTHTYIYIHLCKVPGLLQRVLAAGTGQLP